MRASPLSIRIGDVHLFERQDLGIRLRLIARDQDASIRKYKARHKEQDREYFDCFFLWTQFLLQNSDQSVVRAHVDDAVAFQPGQSPLSDGKPSVKIVQRPASRVVNVEAISKRTGENVMRRHEHGVGIDFEGRGGFPR